MDNLKQVRVNLEFALGDIALWIAVLYLWIHVDGSWWWFAGIFGGHWILITGMKMISKKYEEAEDADDGV